MKRDKFFLKASYPGLMIKNMQFFALFLLVYFIVFLSSLVFYQAQSASNTSNTTTQILDRATNNKGIPEAKSIKFKNSEIIFLDENKPKKVLPRDAK